MGRQLHTRIPEKIGVFLTAMVSPSQMQPAWDKGKINVTQGMDGKVCCFMSHVLPGWQLTEKFTWLEKKKKKHPYKKPAQAAGEAGATEQLRVLSEAADVTQHFAESGNILCGKKGFERWVHDTI